MGTRKVIEAVASSDIVKDALEAYSTPGGQSPTSSVAGTAESATQEGAGGSLTPAPVSTGGVIAKGSYARPSAVFGDDGTMYVGAEGPGMSSMNLFTRTGSGWTGGTVVKSIRGGEADAGRVYVGSICTANGFVYLSMRLGPKEWGTMHGPGVYTMDCKTGKGSFFFPGITVGGARMAVSDGKPYLMAKNGAWGQLNTSGHAVLRGTFPAGGTGEKFDFAVSGAGWFTCHNGCRAEPSAFAYGTVSGGKRVTWADYGTYGRWYGNDLVYPSICPSGDVCYISTVLGGSAKLQVMKNGKPLYPINKLFDLGPAALEDRHPPRMAASPKGAAITYNRGKGDIVWGYIDAMRAGAQPTKIASGSNPTIVWSPAKKAFMIVYVGNNELRFVTVK
jgi:hypothetical protein